MDTNDHPTDPLIDVTVKIREARLADFYAMVGEFNKAPDESGAESEPVEDWTDADGELARQVWERLSGLAKKMFLVLIEADGSKVSAQDLVVQLDLSEASQVAGALAWPRQHARKVNRKLPLSAEVTAEGTSYWLKAVILDLFKKASQDG